MIVQTDELNKRIKLEEDSLFLLYGEEDYFIDMAVMSILRKYIAPGFEKMDHVKLDFGGRSVVTDTLLENLELPAWASSKRVIQAVNFDFDKAAADKMPDILANIPQGAVLIFVTDKFDKRKKKLYDAFVKYGTVCEVKHLEEGKLQRFISTSFSKRNITIRPDACESLISRYDSSMRMIDNAVKRIALYCSAENITDVDMNVVDELCEPDIQADIFKIMDAIGTGDAASALLLLDNLLKQKQPLQYIRFMVARHFRELICAKELRNKQDIMKKMGKRDYPARKLSEQSRNFSMEKLLRLYDMCYRNDYDIKHGRADERASLESLIVLASGR